MNTPIIRTEFMQSIMNDTYPNLAIEAVKGGFDGAWERLIAQQLIDECIRNNSQAIEIVNNVPISEITGISLERVAETSLKAAYLITGSIIPSEATTDIGID